VDLFNLHLGLSARERRQQLLLLARSRELAQLPPEASCLLAGDFNDWRSLLHPIFTEILGFRCATQHSFRYNGAIRTYPAFSPQGGLDKLYARGGLKVVSARRCRLRVSKVASDHLPIVAEMDLN
jgi:endonuclease/exonuclease/phosphatase family metal-dependent hydrolase